jgi:hypothetical protein
VLSDLEALGDAPEDVALHHAVLAAYDALCATRAPTPHTLSFSELRHNVVPQPRAH